MIEMLLFAIRYLKVLIYCLLLSSIKLIMVNSASLRVSCNAAGIIIITIGFTVDTHIAANSSITSLFILIQTTRHSTHWIRVSLRLGYSTATTMILVWTADFITKYVRALHCHIVDLKCSRLRPPFGSDFLPRMTMKKLIFSADTGLSKVIRNHLHSRHLRGKHYLQQRT